MAQYNLYEDKLRRNLERVSDIAAAADVTIILALKAFAYFGAQPRAASTRPV